ncbi:MAG: tetratricopeptide repeat protein [Myxococcota bacterium]
MNALLFASILCSSPPLCDTPEACVRLAEEHLAEDMPSSDTVALYKKACALGDGYACESVANAFEVGLIVDHDAAAALRFFEKACAAHALGGCLAAFRLRFGFEAKCGPGDGLIEACERGCGGGDAWSCACLGDLRMLAGDYGPASVGYARACEGESGYGCAALGHNHQAGRGVDRDPARAHALFRKACDAGESHGCVALGAFMRETLKVSPKEIRAHYDAALARGISRVAPVLARMLLRGEGGERDLGRAHELYKSGCATLATLTAEGCYGLGLTTFFGLGTRASRERGHNRLVYACRLGQSEACALVGDNYLYGRGVKQDIERGRNFRRAGCLRGYAPACDEAR